MSASSRRNFLQSSTAALAGTFIAEAGQAAPAEQGSPPALPASRAFAAIHQPKPLPFDPAKLNGISEKLIRSHWENNYGGSVKTLNAVKLKLAQALADKDTPAFAYDDLKREHLMRTGSVVLHELYFENIGGNGKADADVRKTVGDAFSDFNTWETEFRKIATGLSGGSGWVILGFNTQFGQMENYWLADHLHGPATTVPLLVMDMYEHSYQMDYGAAASKYIDAFFQNVPWEKVAQRLARAQRFATLASA